MAWLKIAVAHEKVLNLLLSSNRVAALSGRTATGPFPEQRQVVTYAAAVGYAAGRRQAVDRSQIQIRDTIMLGAPGAGELGFVLAFQTSDWDLTVVADRDDASDIRLRALEEHAAGGFELLTERFEASGGNISAPELMLLVAKDVRPPTASYQSTESEAVENPLIAALRRRGKLRGVG